MIEVLLWSLVFLAMSSYLGEKSDDKFLLQDLVFESEVNTFFIMVQGPGIGILSELYNLEFMSIELSLYI